MIRTTFFVIARKNFNFFVAIHLSLIMDCFAFIRNDGNDWIASLSLAMTTTTMDCFAFARNDGNDWIASLSLAMTTTTMDCFAFIWNDNNNGLLRSARNDDNGKKKDVYCLIDSRSTALQTKNNDFLFYRFFKFFLFCHTRIL